jgi:hypothetical protein
VSDLSSINFEQMTQADFEQYLPDFFAAGNGRVSEDPRLQKFLVANPDCAALVRDLEAIAEHARSLFDDDTAEEPSDDVWQNIQKQMVSDEEEGTAAATT